MFTLVDLHGYFNAVMYFSLDRRHLSQLFRCLCPNILSSRNALFAKESTLSMAYMLEGGESGRPIVIVGMLIR